MDPLIAAIHLLKLFNADFPVLPVLSFGWIFDHLTITAIRFHVKFFGILGGASIRIENPGQYKSQNQTDSEFYSGLEKSRFSTPMLFVIADENHVLYGYGLYFFLKFVQAVQRVQRRHSIYVQSLQLGQDLI